MTPTFTVLIGSAGRGSLTHTLDSIKRQARLPGDQVIVSIDSHGRGEMPAVQALVRSYGPGFDVCAYDSGYNFCGVEQINFALLKMPITGTRILTLGDDDVYVDGAFAALRPICHEYAAAPVFFQMVDVPPFRRILPDRPRLKMSWISGCCIAAPVQFVRPMPTNRTWPNGAPFVEHDYFWMERIVQEAGTDPIWVDRVLVIARPDARGDDVAHAGIVRCWHCHDWRWAEDVAVTDVHCPKCHAIIDISEVTPLHAGSSYQGARTVSTGARSRRGVFRGGGAEVRA